jgi:hypothetical protein
VSERVPQGQLDVRFLQPDTKRLDDQIRRLADRLGVAAAEGDGPDLVWQCGTEPHEGFSIPALAHAMLDRLAALDKRAPA